MSTEPLSVKEVRALLNHLRKSGIKAFEGLGFKVEFSDATHVANPTTVRPTKASAQKAAENEQQSFLVETAELVEDRISTALIENPAEYEQMLREEELEHVRGETSQDRGPEPSL